MSAFDKRLLWCWLIITAVAVAQMLVPWLISILILTGIGIPLALLFGVFPGLWVYLTPTLIIYALLRRQIPRAAKSLLLITAATPPLAIGIAIPVIANGETDRRVAELLSGDMGSHIQMPKGVSVTHLIDRSLISYPIQCHDDCQRLLITGTAGAYIEAERDQLTRLGNLSAPVPRFSLGIPDGNCRNTLLTPARASDEEVGRTYPFPRPLLREKLDERGVCLHAAPTDDARSDFVMVETWNYGPKHRGFRFGGSFSHDRYVELRLYPVAPFRRWEVYRQVGDALKLVLRRTQVTHARLSVPLWLVPGFAFDTYTPAHWVLTGRKDSGEGIDQYRSDRWEPWIVNDIGVAGPGAK